MTLQTKLKDSSDQENNRQPLNRARAGHGGYLLHKWENDRRPEMLMRRLHPNIAGTDIETEIN